MRIRANIALDLTGLLDHQGVFILYNDALQLIGCHRSNLNSILCRKPM